MVRRGPAQWGREDPPAQARADLDILIPCYGRPAELAVTLSGLAAQPAPGFRVLMSDQSPSPVAEEPAVAAMIRLLRAQGRPVQVWRNLPRRGMAHQRQVLLERSRADHVLYLDSDVWLEPGTPGRLLDAIRASGAGFVGAAVQGLSYLGDRRPADWELFRPWDGPVRPEPAPRQGPAAERWRLHNAANLAHLAARWHLSDTDRLLSRVAWVGGCVLFDRQVLVECGGFDFWDRLPEEHAGEDVLAQWRVMERRGGAGILPSGAVHLEAPTTITERGCDARTLWGETSDGPAAP